MEGNTCFVTLSIEACGSVIYDAVVGGSITGELIDHYAARGPDGLCCAVMVFEKHYWRAGNRLTLTVTMDNLLGKTRVHFIGGGGGEGLFRFDWGAAEDFAGAAAAALRPFVTEPETREESEEI